MTTRGRQAREQGHGHARHQRECSAGPPKRRSLWAVWGDLGGRRLSRLPRSHANAAKARPACAASWPGGVRPPVELKASPWRRDAASLSAAIANG
jgi:hypothetical protein